MQNQDGKKDSDGDAKLIDRRNFRHVAAFNALK